MGDEPLVPGPLYGLRTWSVVGEAGSERLAAPQRAVTWPEGGAWLEAECDAAHAAPAPGCDCGVHAWHPRVRAARRVVAARREVPGVVEASGAIELHEDGFRAQRARPYALVLAAGRNPGQVRRLAAVYGVPVVEAGRPHDLVDWCRERGLGLAEPVVAGLLGGAALAERRRERRRRKRLAALRTAAMLAVVALLLAIGLVATDSPGDRTLSGRTGEVQQQR
jgi:hypothetical protein